MLKSPHFRHERDHILGGAVVGLAVLAGWFITAGPMGRAWKEYAEFASEIPSRVQPQSFTFISPMGDGVRYLSEPANFTLTAMGLSSCGYVPDYPVFGAQTGEEFVVFARGPHLSDGWILKILAPQSLLHPRPCCRRCCCRRGHPCLGCLL